MDHVTTCKILQSVPSSFADDVYLSVLIDLLNDADKCNQFLPILLNGHFSAELVAHFESKLFPKWVTVLAANKDIDQPFKIGLAFVDDDTFRDRYLCVDERLGDASVGVDDDLMTRRRLFLLTVVQRQHFVEKFIYLDDAIRMNLSNNVLRRTLCLVHLFRNVDLPITEHQQLINEIRQIPICLTNNSLRRNLFNEVQRLLTLNELLVNLIPNIELTSNVSKFSVIDILYESVNLSTVDTESVLTILEENGKYNQRYDCDRNETGSQLTEWQLYNQFLVVKLLLEVIMENQQVTTLCESSVIKLSRVKMLLNHIESIEQLASILQVVFSLIFLRRDNIIYNCDPVEFDLSVYESDSEIMKSPRKNSNRSEKEAFVCCAVVLDIILSLLKNVAEESFNFNALTDDSVKNFWHQLLSNINDAHWRMTLFNSNAKMAGSRSASLISEDVRKYFGRHRSHVRKNLHSSSDDNDKNSQHSTSTYRRKPRKRKSTEDRPLATANSTEPEQRSDALSRSISGSERRCPISRLFGSPVHLATICLNAGKFEATKEIVEVMLNSIHTQISLISNDHFHSTLFVHLSM